MTKPDLRLTRLLPVPVHEVFEAWTNPAIMVDWFFAGQDWSVEVETDLVVGGEFSLLMRTETGEEFLCSGVYREISPPNRLVFTWTSYAVKDTLVTLELRDMGGSTELTLLHEGLIDPEIRENHAGGWGGCLANLEKALVTGAG
jgi:uncharacterized protein YndB with AHSA1/START domain